MRFSLTTLVLSSLVAWGGGRAATADEAAADSAFPTRSWTEYYDDPELDESSPSDTAIAAEKTGGCNDCCDDGCDSCGSCDPCVSPFSVRIGAVILERDSPDSQVLLNDQFAAGGTTLIDASDYDFGVHGGIDVGMVYRGANVDLDFRYFGVDEFTAELGPLVSANGAVARFVTPLGVPGTPTSVLSEYGSELHSFEANVRWPFWQRFGFLAGFRTVELDETLGIGLDIGPGVNLAGFGVETTNRLYGIQLGLDGSLPTFWDRFTIEGSAKGGIYGNSASSSAGLFQTVGPSFGASDSDTQVAFVGDVGLAGVFQIADHWSIRGGYQLLWIEGVAIAADQFASTDLAAGFAATDTDGGAFYHGATVGLQFDW